MKLLVSCSHVVLSLCHVNVLFCIAFDCLEYVVIRKFPCSLNQCGEQWIYTVGFEKSETIKEPALKMYI